MPQNMRHFACSAVTGIIIQNPSPPLSLSSRLKISFLRPRKKSTEAALFFPHALHVQRQRLLLRCNSRLPVLGQRELGESCVPVPAPSAHFPDQVCDCAGICRVALQPGRAEGVGAFLGKGGVLHALIFAAAAAVSVDAAKQLAIQAAIITRCSLPPQPECSQAHGQCSHHPRRQRDYRVAAAERGGTAGRWIEGGLSHALYIPKCTHPAAPCMYVLNSRRPTCSADNGLCSPDPLLLLRAQLV